MSAFEQSFPQHVRLGWAHRGRFCGWRGRPASLRKTANRALLTEIRRVHMAHRGRYGAPRIYAALRARGYMVSRGRVDDTTTFVRATIHDVLITLVIAFALVVSVVFVFLGSLRATLIPAIAVPVSVIGSFAVLLAMGYSANTISLLAMVLAIGIVVDDAIVVVENVERVMEEEPNLSPADAAKKAMTEITAPIIAITLVLLSVFVPIAVIPGISGQLFRQFAVTISVAMLISALNALTLSPALCAVFLRHGGPERGPMGWVLRRIDNIRDGYAAIVRRLVRVSVLGVVLILAAAAGIFGLSLRTPTGFLPEEDQGAFFISVQLPDGAAIGRWHGIIVHAIAYRRGRGDFGRALVAGLERRLG
jgi:multidrug efflux pump subunit AcrB